MRKKILGAAAAGVVLLLIGVSGICMRPQNVCTQQILTEIPQDWFAAQSVRVSAEAEENARQTEPEKIVCLTFDDGPSKTTKEILEILEEHDVLATFFIMAADNNRDYLPLVEQEAAAGHQIALHSCSHDYKKIYASDVAYWADIKNLRQQLEAYVDVDSIHWIRFPGGSTNTVAARYGGSGLMKRLQEQAQEKGYRCVDWNVCAQDAAGGDLDAEQIAENVIQGAQDKDVCVVLMHDTNATESTADALPEIISWFCENGYRFCTVEQMYQQIND